jgi:hypothetical protein
MRKAVVAIVVAGALAAFVVFWLKRQPTTAADSSLLA